MSKQRGAARAPRRLPVPFPILVLFALVLGAAGYSLIAPGARAAEHPAPRAGITAAKVQPPERYAQDPQIAQVYAEVAKIAPVIDGLYCHCECASHSGHYSLLTCFEDDHGANCDICLGAAHLAYAMTQRGASLDQIRSEVDRQFGRKG